MEKKLVKPMTREGFERLMREAQDLFHVVRPKVLQGIQDAAAEGDRSENAEYIYGKKRLRELDKRIRYLDSILKDVQVIDRRSLRGQTVSFGATVVVADIDGKEHRWTIVGEGEANADEGTISWKAPVAKALLGKRVGDVVTVTVPAGESEYEVLGLSFGDQEPTKQL